MRIAVEESGADGGEEERGHDRAGMQLVAPAGVGGERGDGACMQRDLARLAELGEADRQDAFGEVDVVAVESEGLTDAEPGDGQQPDEGLEGGRPQRRTHRSGGGHQRGEVDVGIQVGRGPMTPAGQQTDRGHLVGGVDGMQVTREAPHHRQPLRPPVRRAVGRKGGPCPRRVSGDRVGPVRLHVGDEVSEQQRGALQLVPEGPANGEVVVEIPMERAHDALPGHGRAKARNAVRSTLA